jgi:hypothetical protein
MMIRWRILLPLLLIDMVTLLSIDLSADDEINNSDTIDLVVVVAVDRYGKSCGCYRPVQLLLLVFLPLLL